MLPAQIRNWCSDMKNVKARDRSMRSMSDRAAKSYLAGVRAKGAAAAAAAPGAAKKKAAKKGAKKPGGAKR
jgi:hypothetical protein